MLIHDYLEELDKQKRAAAKAAPTVTKETNVEEEIKKTDKPKRKPKAE